MTRLADPDPSTVPADVREFVAQFPPDTMVKMLTHSVTTVQPFIQLAQIIFTALELPARTRELVILTVAASADCEFVAAQHGPIAAAAGVPDRLRDLIAQRDFGNPDIAPEDQAIIRLTIEVITRPRVPDEVFGQVREILSDREIVEVLQVCGYYWTFCRIATVLDVPVSTVYSSVPALDERSPDGTS